MKVRISALGCALVIGLSGCGDESRDPPEPSPGISPTDKKGLVLDCLRQEGFTADFSGDDSIQIEGPEGPRVDFFLSGGESESRQFAGEAQGAMQIGSTLVFVADASDEDLEIIEACVVG